VKNNYTYVVIFGEDEKQAGNFIIKDLRTGEERREAL